MKNRILFSVLAWVAVIFSVQGKQKDFVLQSGQPVEIACSGSEVPVVRTSLDLLSRDLQTVLSATAHVDTNTGNIIVGTIGQSKLIEQAGIDIDCALSIEIADETIIERMSGRRTCKDCSQTFHIVSNPPKVEGKCDFCGGELTIRKDDAPETVKARLETYHRETEPLKAFYESRGKLKSVENQPTIEATTEVIKAALGI